VDQELLTAVEIGDYEKVSRLVQSGKVDLNYRDPNTGETMLEIAYQLGWYGIIQLLLKAGADPEQVSQKGMLKGNIFSTEQ
jgi:ankyrin repeat protein